MLSIPIGYGSTNIIGCNIDLNHKNPFRLIASRSTLNKLILGICSKNNNHPLIIPLIFAEKVSIFCANAEILRKTKKILKNSRILILKFENWAKIDSVRTRMLQRSKILPQRIGNDVSYEEYLKMSKKNRIVQRHKEPGNYNWK